ncbi:MAG: hypothetical protein R2745_22095 [Vicinamibacterales bacterium]
MAWTVASFFVVETLTFGLAVLPAFVAWEWVLTLLPATRPLLRPSVLAMSLVPAYAVFAVALAALSAWGSRLLGWRTPPPGEWSIRECPWPVLRWSRYMMSTHVVRVFVGTFFRSTLLWVWYFRWNGATVGRGVYINSLTISDHNMLTLGDGVVIGGGVHMSGHTVEHGMLRTGTVALGRGVTVGVGSVVGIDVTAGEGCHIGALSVVPKHARLDADAVYVGAPVARLPRD